MTAREFWTRWRREIMRGTFLFAAVLAVGFLIISGVHRASSRVRDLAFDLGGDRSGPRSEWAPWTFAAKLGTHQTLWLRNTRGPITVTTGNDDSVHVTAVRTFRHSNPESVHLVTGTGPKGVAVCAVWGNTVDGACVPDPTISVKGHGGDNDVDVRFEVQLPRGAATDVQSVSGDVKADVAGPVTAATVQGDVAVTSTSDRVSATTVTGDVSVQLPGVLNPKSIQAKTVTGDVSVELPRDACAAVSGHTVTGDITTAFAVPVTGKFASHEMSGTIGKGGGSVNLETVTGDIALNNLENAPALAPTPPPPPAPPTRTRVRVNVSTPPPGKQ